jgi:hypothetical protein
MRHLRTMLAAVLALSVLVGAVGTALAATYDDGDFPRDFWKKQERTGP